MTQMVVQDKQAGRAAPGPFRSFDEFWPHYVGEHRHPLCRLLHYLGGLGAIACVLWALVRLEPIWLAGAPVVGYACAWTAHLFIEGNKPATFGHPQWSARAEFKMLALGLSGRMGREVDRLYPPDRG